VLADLNQTNSHHEVTSPRAPQYEPSTQTLSQSHIYPSSRIIPEEDKTTPPKLLGQKRAPTNNSLSESMLEPDADFHNDAQVKLSDPDLLKRKTLFAKYTPYTVTLIF